MKGTKQIQAVPLFAKFVHSFYSLSESSTNGSLSTNSSTHKEPQKMTDQNLEKIKETVHTILPESKIILFGSRAREEFRDDSDYDIMVVTNHDFSVKEKRQYASRIRKKLAKMKIDVDVIVKTGEDVSYYRDKLGSIVREAILGGVSL